MFAGNKKLLDGVEVMNKVENSKFPLLLNRIALSVLNDTSNKPFTAEEESKLEVSLEITKSEIQSIIETTVDIFHIASYHLMKPAILNEQLQQNLKLEPKKAEAFIVVWSNSAKGIIENLKQKSALLKQLNHISYSISVETASDMVSKGKIPRAQLQLGLLYGDEREDINIEFTHAELYEFYKKLEQVQTQLDSLR